MSTTSRDAGSVGPARVTRRRALSGVATAGVTLPLLSACGGDEPAASAPAPTDSAPASETTSPTTTGPTGEATPEPTPEPEPDSLASTADIPVGGGVVFTDSRVVVTQPEAGEFRCFSAVCTHTGCLVTGVSTAISCPCHDSSFDLATGEVLGGPAPAPLPPVAFTIDQNQVVLT